MKTVGEILSQERKNKNLTLEEVERSTKIRRKTLLSLEKSDWENLPSPTFVKGLIKNYGKLLGLDEKELIAFYRREYDERRDQKKLLGRKTIPTSRFRFTPQIVTFAVIALAFFIIAVYLFIQYQSFTGAPLLELSEPKNNIKVNSREVNLIGKTWEDAILKVNGQDVAVSPGGTFSLAVGLNPGLNTITVTAANRFGKISTEKRTVVVDLVNNQAIQSQQEEVKIVVKAIADSVNLSIEIDGQKDFDGVLVAGSEKTFAAKERIKLLSKNAGSTTVLYKGSEEVLGKMGEAVERIYQE